MPEHVMCFNVEGMTCGNCVATIETNLLAEVKDITKINIDLVTKRARIAVNKKVNPETVIQAVSDVGFNASYIPEANKKILRFSLKGLKNHAEGVQIVNHLESDPTLIESCQLNHTTRVLTIVAFADSSANALTGRVKRKIKQAVRNPQLIPELVLTPFEGRFKAENPRHFYRKALVNAVVAIAMMFAGGYIPLPITLYGQLIGLAIGGITLGIMGSTGKEFYKDAWQQFIKHFQFNMNTLIALGTGSAWVYSMIQVLAPMLFPVAALSYQFMAIYLILGIVNLGKGIRGVAQERAKKEVLSLEEVFLNLQPPIARVVKKAVLKKKKDLSKITDNDIEQKRYEELEEGDVFLVPAGERCPTEGRIISNKETRVTQETLTGESTPLDKKKGDEVYSGSHNHLNPIFVKATRAGKDNYLTKVIADVAAASNSKPSISKLVDKIARVFVPSIIILSALTAAGWFFFGPVPALPWMIKSAMSVLLCACPCALGLATPISNTVGIHAMVNNGALIHDAQAMEAAADIDVVAFDKTGTLTTQRVAKVAVKSRDYSEDEILQHVVSLESACVKQGHDHPIARSFMNQEINFDLLPCTSPKKDDQGVSGKIDEQEVLVGTYAHLESRHVTNLGRFVQEEKNNAKAGMSSVYVSIGGKCVAVIGLRHEIQPEARKAVQELKRMGIRVYMITGDKALPAKKVAEQVGIDFVLSEKNHKEKEAIIKALKRNHTVAMAGDGINDLDAIRAASVGIAVGPWTHASSAAHIAVHNLNLVPMILIARQTMRNIRQNLLWTGLYNVLMITASMGLLYPLFGIVLNPVVASIAMSLSSLIVVLNSCRLIYQIDHALGRYHRKINRPRTIWQKMEEIFAIRGLIKVMGLILGMNQEKTNFRHHGDVLKTIKPEPMSPPRRRQRTRAVLKNLPAGVQIKKERNPVIVIDDVASPRRLTA